MVWISGIELIKAMKIFDEKCAVKILKLAFCDM
jgi:hypothetical protein